MGKIIGNVFLFTFLCVFNTILIKKFFSMFSSVSPPHRKSDFCAYKTTIETMGVMNGGKYKHQLRNDLLLPLFSCKVNKEFIIEGKFIEAKEVKFSPFACILSQSKEGYRD